MSDIVKNVWEIYNKLSKEDKRFLGGPLYSNNVRQQIKNYLEFSQKKSLDKQRLAIGIPLSGDNGNLIGYSYMTIMNNASPTKYEKTFIGLTGKLNYVQNRYFLLDPDYRGMGYSDELLNYNMELAEELKKDLVLDVILENKHMIDFLERHSIFEDFRWKNDKGQTLCRMTK